MKGWIVYCGRVMRPAEIRNVGIRKINLRFVGHDATHRRILELLLRFQKRQRRREIARRRIEHELIVTHKLMSGHGIYLFGIIQSSSVGNFSRIRGWQPVLSCPESFLRRRPGV